MERVSSVLGTTSRFLRVVDIHRLDVWLPFVACSDMGLPFAACGDILLFAPPCLVYTATVVTGRRVLLFLTLFFKHDAERF